MDNTPDERIGREWLHFDLGVIPGTWGHYDHAPHDDSHADEPHVDYAHGDLHGDEGHDDESHGDVHADAQHADGHWDDPSHSDDAHADHGHDDTHHDSFGDVHGDEGHGDEGHDDDSHSDYHYDLHQDHDDTARPGGGLLHRLEEFLARLEQRVTIHEAETLRIADERLIRLAGETERVLYEVRIEFERMNERLSRLEAGRGGEDR